MNTVHVWNIEKEKDEINEYGQSSMVLIRVPAKYEKLSNFFLNWGKVVPWLVLWKNGFNLVVALKLWSRRAAQILRTP